jgi:hypothetical protein
LDRCGGVVDVERAVAGEGRVDGLSNRSPQTGADEEARARAGDIKGVAGVDLRRVELRRDVVAALGIGERADREVLIDDVGDRPCVGDEPTAPKMTLSVATGTPAPPVQLAGSDQLPGGVVAFHVTVAALAPAVAIAATAAAAMTA